MKCFKSGSKEDFQEAGTFDIDPEVTFNIKDCVEYWQNNTIEIDVVNHEALHSRYYLHVACIAAALTVIVEIYTFSVMNGWSILYYYKWKGLNKKGENIRKISEIKKRKSEEQAESKRSSQHRPSAIPVGIQHVRSKSNFSIHNVIKESVSSPEDLEQQDVRCVGISSNSGYAFNFNVIF